MEQHWLPLLAPRLPLPIPVPVRVGKPSTLFPSTWSVTQWVAGVPADHAPISHPEAADVLAEFLLALHRPAPDDAPANRDRGIAMKPIRHYLDAWFPLVESTDQAADVRRIWEDACAAPEWDQAPVWMHGDLHPANVIVADGTLAGVIDFEEICGGDPAGDIAAAWVLLPAGAAPRFFDSYGPTDDATLRRARGWAVLRSLVLIGIGQMWERGEPGGKQTWGPAGRAALERVLAG